jgi:hypothetical protein
MSAAYRLPDDADFSEMVIYRSVYQKFDKIFLSVLVLYKSTSTSADEFVFIGRHWVPDALLLFLCVLNHKRWKQTLKNNIYKLMYSRSVTKCFSEPSETWSQ